MSANFEIRQCKPDELPAVIVQLDHEFIFNKQRSLSLCKRYPHTLSCENIENIRLAVSNNTICGAHTIRIFDWLADNNSWRGAMIGMVWVDIQERHKGIAATLLSSTEDFLKKKKIDFGVLWTGTPTLYEGVGWFLKDCGLFGKAMRHSDLNCEANISLMPLVSVDVDYLEYLRSKFHSMRVKRSALDYQTTPIPAEQVLCFKAQDNKTNEGFALVGAHGKTGYVYEVVAPQSLWETIWTAINESFNYLFVNGHYGDTFSHWLTQQGFVKWEQQNKTMWLFLSQRMNKRFLDSWHIPYFDWV